MKLLFKLKSPKEANTLLLIIVSHGGQRFVKSTGLKVTSEGWDQTRQRHRDRAINQVVAAIRHDYEKLMLDCLAAGADPIEQLRKEKNKPDTITPWQLADQNRVNYDFIANWIPPSTRWEEITPAWVNAIITKMAAKGLSVNSQKEGRQKVKSLLRKANREGLAQFDMDKFAGVKEKGEDATSIYLTVDELRKMARANLPPNLDNARKLFLIGAYTGLRFSDYSKLSPADFSGEFLSWRAKKTAELTTVPISDALRQVVANGFPVPIHRNHMNKCIKEVAMLSGINEPVTWSRTVGVRKVVKVLPKWQLVSSHTARRSFATNLYLAGVDVISLMRFTGHRTPQSFMRYLRVTNQETAERLKEKIKGVF